MNGSKKGRVIAIICLAGVSAGLLFVPSRMTAVRYLAIFVLVVSAINILLSYVVASPSSRLGQRLVLFASISIACLVVGVLLLKTVTIVGVVLVCASLLLNWFVVRPVQKRLREHDVR